MGHPTMPLPRIPDLSLPSFRELDESVEANRRNQPSSHPSENVCDGTGYSSSSSPQKINPIPNPYPPYPANGWHIPPDPSQNAFRGPGFTSHDVFAGVVQRNRNVDRERNCTPQLPQRLKETLPFKVSPTPTLSTLSSTQSTVREPLSPDTPVSSTPERNPSNAPRETLINRAPARDQVHRQRVNHDAVAAHRAQRRRVGVRFSEVAAHTAKCDVCNKRNKNGMSRCQNCGWQICRKCLTDRNGDRTHASFGATHVPEGGGDMPMLLPGVDGNQDHRSSESIAEVRAAQTLLDLGSVGNGVGTTTLTRDMKGTAGGQKVVPARGRVLQQQVNALSTGSDVTLSVVGDAEWPQNESDIPIGEDGLPVGYIITRRNPARAARPSTKLAE